LPGAYCSAATDGALGARPYKSPERRFPAAVVTLSRVT
jgi:hypothetical protein